MDINRLYDKYDRKGNIGENPFVRSALTDRSSTGVHLFNIFTNVFTVNGSIADAFRGSPHLSSFSLMVIPIIRGRRGLKNDDDIVRGGGRESESYDRNYHK